MIEIKRSNGTVVARGRNLRVLRDAVREHPVEHITLSRDREKGGGILHVLFTQTRVYGDRFKGAACTAEFADYAVMCDFVRRWRSVADVPITLPNREYASVQEWVQTESN